MNAAAGNILPAKSRSRPGIASVVIALTIPLLLITFFVLGITLGTRKVRSEVTSVSPLPASV